MNTVALLPNGMAITTDTIATSTSLSHPLTHILKSKTLSLTTLYFKLCLPFPAILTPGEPIAKPEKNPLLFGFLKAY